MKIYKALFLGVIITIGIIFSGCLGGKITKVQVKNIFQDFFPKDVADIEIVGEDLRIVLKNKVFFDKGKSQIKEEAKPSLDKIIDVYMTKILPAYPNSNIIVEGYADSDGSESYNLKLSENRANSVISYLANENLAISIPTNKLEAIGYGESNPRVPNTSEENKAINRRVELVFHGMNN